MFPTPKTWFIWFVALASSWAVLEAIAIITRSPTLSQTVWRWEKDRLVNRLLLLAGLSFLTAHLVFGLP
jgi:hypothetical protein